MKRPKKAFATPLQRFCKSLFSGDFHFSFPLKPVLECFNHRGAGTLSWSPRPSITPPCLAGRQALRGSRQNKGEIRRFSGGGSPHTPLTFSRSFRPRIPRIFQAVLNDYRSPAQTDPLVEPSAHPSESHSCRSVSPVSSIHFYIFHLSFSVRISHRILMSWRTAFLLKRIHVVFFLLFES